MCDCKTHQPIVDVLLWKEQCTKCNKYEGTDIHFSPYIYFDGLI